MDIRLVIGASMAIVGTIGILYLLLQLYRNQRIFNIRATWIINDDSRRYNYTYMEMFIPCKDNWYGLKIPRDKHFKS